MKGKQRALAGNMPGTSARHVSDAILPSNTTQPTL